MFPPWYYDISQGFIFHVWGMKFIDSRLHVLEPEVIFYLNKHDYYYYYNKYGVWYFMKTSHFHIENILKYFDLISF